MPNNEYVRVRISGDFACFTRPEAKVERVSYECITPSAARNILDAILFKPEMRWIVTSIAVLKPIAFQALRRNEVQSKIAPGSVKKWMADSSEYRPMVAGAGTDEGTPRNTLALRDVAYVIRARPLVYAPTPENTPIKYIAMFNRRVEKGQCFHRPSLGCREFAAEFSLPTEDDVARPVSLDLGRMLYDVVYSGDGTSNRAVFFQASIEDGIVDTRPETAIPDAKLRDEVLSCSSKR